MYCLWSFLICLVSTPQLSFPVTNSIKYAQHADRYSKHVHGASICMPLSLMHAKWCTPYLSDSVRKRAAHDAAWPHCADALTHYMGVEEGLENLHFAVRAADTPSVKLICCSQRKAKALRACFCIEAWSGRTLTIWNWQGPAHVPVEGLTSPKLWGANVLFFAFSRVSPLAEYLSPLMQYFKWPRNYPTEAWGPSCSVWSGKTTRIGRSQPSNPLL